MTRRRRVNKSVNGSRPEPKSEDQLRKEAESGEEAKRVLGGTLAEALENKTFAEAMNALRNYMNAQILSLQPEQVDEFRFLKYRVKSLEDIVGIFRAYVQQGESAIRRLTDYEEARKHRDARDGQRKEEWPY